MWCVVFGSKSEVVVRLDAALPAHTSHTLQTLDVGVFFALKERFKQYLGERTISAKRDMRNDVFAMTEIVTKAYDDTFCIRNIKGGFRSSAGWPLSSSIVLERHNYHEGNSTSTANAHRPSVQNFIGRHTELLRQFRRESGQLSSDALAPGTSFVSTTSGAKMTSANILYALLHSKEKNEGRRN